ncbi:Carbon-nitrogen hydrolase [Hartmannibacter diazotrophicus]|uniref:Carbon-nitrogen hydrolase n=1 Tax=Hartmannibacter diazotrophicus TaxID=1482074 RepID=A0A2C9D4P0_9HYPH|nr:carbon-nitrogen hydrolase family protein [Hartmannibacter diazotrophicus]SON55139.1 Carbon-nitrogen hydrolase [Hartmannibacter diazotrophicus]
MTRNRNLKQRVRARAAKTGESYTSALRHIRQSLPQRTDPGARSIRIAVAQTTLFNDPRDVDGLRASGCEIRCMMREAHDAGARLVHFPEGATCSPNKRIMSSQGPRDIGPSDWDRFEWAVLREELDTTRRLARDLGLWAVLGSVHRLTPPHRPHNSLYVLSDLGELVTRYDERMLSNTKVSYMYSPGLMPVTFEVDGVRFGCALGMETHFPEIFLEYERLNVDCMLFSTTGESTVNASAFAAEALGHAASCWCWVSFSAHAPQSRVAPSGIAAPDGSWAAQCRCDGTPSLAVATVEIDPAHPARPWRRTARGGIYDPHQAKDDPRSESRNSF